MDAKDALRFRPKIKFYKGSLVDKP